MPSIFDLSKISRLVHSHHPARILLMDTNIVMNAPDPDDWSVKAAGQSLFVLSDTVLIELALIGQKKGSKERLESSHKADIATKSLASLFGKGSITEGIAVKGGWVVCVSTPKTDELDSQLEQLKDIVDVLGRSDTKLLLFTKECHQLFASTPVTLLTGDRRLYNIVEAQGIPCHLCISFPVEGLKQAAAAIAPVDWDEELAEIQAKIAENALVVEATLTAQRSAPSWLMSLTETKQFIVAEGHGVLRMGNGVRPFLWTIAFYPQTIEPQSSAHYEGRVDLPSIHLGFFGEDDFAQDLFDSIADRLLDCINMSFEEGKPTLQGTQSIMEMLIYFEYLLREGMPEGGLDKLRQEIEESEGLASYWTDWILDIEDKDERYACLEGLVQALSSRWEIGQTYTFSIIRGQEECPSE